MDDEQRKNNPVQEAFKKMTDKQDFVSR